MHGANDKRDNKAMSILLLPYKVSSFIFTLNLTSLSFLHMQKPTKRFLNQKREFLISFVWTFPYSI